MARLAPEYPSIQVILMRYQTSAGSYEAASPDIGSCVTDPQRTPIYSWATSFKICTSWPGLNAGRPRYGHPSQRKASPSAQLPQEPVLPWTVKSSSFKSPVSSFITFKFLSAVSRRSLSSASRRSARPHVQSLQAFRLLPVFGWHSGASE